MALSPVPEPRLPLPAASEDPLHVSLAAVMERRSLSVSAVGSLLRAEGIAISRTRLHQLSSGTGAQPTAEQLERLASVLGVNPAMANFDRLRGRRGIPFERDADGDEGPRYPGQVSSR